MYSYCNDVNWGVAEIFRGRAWLEKASHWGHVLKGNICLGLCAWWWATLSAPTSWCQVILFYA